ncbi:hypothetical protein [Thermanaerothrix sp.]|uniref:hypothetical protein n=1 Tax=Thermanaerothrix sp. TaxID=2972675 RepID=UPI003C7CF23F
MSRWHIALDLILTMLYLAGWALALIGLGWVGLAPLWRRLVRRDGCIALLPLLALAWLCGLLVNYSLVLIVSDLRLALGIGTALAVMGLAHLGFTLHRAVQAGNLAPGSSLTWLGTGLMLLLYAVPILTQPLQAWDARSIWFFHARMIYVAGALGPETGLQHPALVFSHPDYPNLIPALAAQLTTLRGFWNEYLPKAALWLALGPAFLGLFALARQRIAFLFLLTALPFSLGGWLWNGYMDAHLALYLALGLLFIGRALRSEDDLDFFLGFTTLAFLPNIKNEGYLASLVSLIAWGIAAWQGRKFGRVGHWLEALTPKVTWFYCGLIALPMGLWNVKKALWGLNNDLQLGSAGSLARLLTRLGDGSLETILRMAYPYLQGGILVLLFSVTVLILQRRALPSTVHVALLTAGLYLLGLLAIYLATPHDLNWHLRTSISRTLLGVNAAAFVAGYFMLGEIEEK